MPKSKVRKVPDLSKLADEAMEALNFLYAQGYVEQVDIIRNLITAQGEEFALIRKIQRDINNDLSKKAKAASGSGRT